MMARAGMRRKASEGAAPTIADAVALYGRETVRGALRERALLTRALASPSAWASFRAACRAMIASDDKQGLLTCFQEPTRRALVLAEIHADFLLDVAHLDGIARLDAKKRPR